MMNWKNLFKKKRVWAGLITAGLTAAGVALPPEVTFGVIEILSSVFEGA